MEPIIVSQEDYEKGNYPKGVPVMVGMKLQMEGKGRMNVGPKEQTKIRIVIKKAE